MKQTAYSLKDIENINDYEQQAQEFLRLTNSTLQVRYLRTGLYFGETDIKNTRDIYEFKLTHDGREYISEFGDSLQNTWKRFQSCMSISDNYSNPEKTFKSHYDKDGTKDAMRRYNKENNILKACEWEYHNAKPTEYSILACLSAYEPPATFDDFIAEYGYEIDSKASYENALTTYGNVVKEWTSLLTLYNNDELQALASIQ